VQKRRITVRMAKSIRIVRGMGSHSDRTGSEFVCHRPLPDLVFLLCARDRQYYANYFEEMTEWNEAITAFSSEQALTTLWGTPEDRGIEAIAFRGPEGVPCYKGRYASISFSAASRRRGNFCAKFVVGLMVTGRVRN